MRPLIVSVVLILVLIFKTNGEGHCKSFSNTLQTGSYLPLILAALIGFYAGLVYLTDRELDEDSNLNGQTYGKLLGEPIWGRGRKALFMEAATFTVMFMMLYSACCYIAGKMFFH